MRRRTVTMLAAGVSLVSALTAQAQQLRPTAAEIIERIKKNVNAQWREQGTVDVFKAGDPATPVTGIATTFIASLDVLQRAAASGKNLIITHEPTFYNHTEDTSAIGEDAVLAAKRDFIRKHGLVVWRFHDHWHAHRPDGINEGMVQKLGWAKYRRQGPYPIFDLPPTTLAKLAAGLKATFGARTVRVVGDPALQVRTAAFTPGAPPPSFHFRALAMDGVDVVIGGESREWEAVEYARDAATAGKRKAFVLLGHVLSEEAGMAYCAEWMKKFVTEVPVEFIPAGEPFWSPK